MARGRKLKKPLVWKFYDYLRGHPGMTRDGVRIDAEGNISAKSEMLRDFDAELGQLERRVEENLKELGYPVFGDNARTPAWRHLFGIKRTIFFIRKHREQGDDVSPLIFDLGLQVGRARAADEVSESRSVRGKQSGQKRKDALATLKKQAREAFEGCLERTRKPEQAYQAAAHKVKRSRRTVRRWLAGK